MSDGPTVGLALGTDDWLAFGVTIGPVLGESLGIALGTALVAELGPLLGRSLGKELGVATGFPGEVAPGVVLGLPL